MHDKLLDRFFNGEIYFICRSENDVAYLLDMAGNRIMNRDAVLRDLAGFTEKRLWIFLEYEIYHVFWSGDKSKNDLISYAALVIPEKEPVSIKRLYERRK